MYVEINGKKYYSGYSNIVSSKPYAGGASNLDLTVNGVQVGVSFTGTPDVSGYIVSRSLSANGPFENLTFTPEEVGYNPEDKGASVIINCEEFTNYFIKVRAFATVGSTKYYGAYSEVKTIETGSRIPPEYVPVMDAVHELAGQFTSRYELRNILLVNFSEDEVNFAIENAELDWRIVALDYVNSLLAEDKYSETDITNYMTDDEFTADEISFALREVDFGEVALSKIKEDTYRYYSEVKLRELLSQRHFTLANIDYAISHLTTSFDDIAYNYAFVNSLHKTVEELRTLLANAEFTESQITSAINRINENVYAVKYTTRQNEGTVTIGDVITIGGEEFNVLTTNDTTTELLAKNPIVVGNGASQSDYYERQGLVSNNLGTTQFNDSNYWHDELNDAISNTYGDDYPAYVYDSNSSISTQISRYITLLNNLDVIEVTGGRILSLADILALGCTEEYDYYVPECSLAPSWLTNNPSNVPIWLGNAIEKNRIMTLNGARLGNDIFANNNAVRPVLTVNTSDLPE